MIGISVELVNTCASIRKICTIRKSVHNQDHCYIIHIKDFVVLKVSYCCSLKFKIRTTCNIHGDFAVAPNIHCDHVLSLPAQHDAVFPVMLSVGRCGIARLQMKIGHMGSMHCFIDSTSILIKIKLVSLYNCRTVYYSTTQNISKTYRPQ